MNNNSHLHIFVLIDALGWPYVANRPFLTDELVYRTPVQTVLGFSSGAIPTILTGKPPSRNGHWNLFYYDPAGSPFRWLRYLNFVPDRLLDSRLSRKVVKEIGRHVLGLGPLFECCVSPRVLPWFNWVEKRSIYERGGIAKGPSFFDILAERTISCRVYTYRNGTDDEILGLARQDLKKKKAGVFFLYLSEMDAYLHLHCHEPEKVSKRLAWYESELRRVYETARRMDSELTFSVFSDHGMTPVQEHFDLMKEIESLRLRQPEDYLAVYDSTMARFWFFNERARQAVLSRLGSVFCGRILSDQELGRLGVFFPDRRYGETIFLMNPGVLLARSDFHGNGWMPKGMHGYHPDDPHSDGLFLSNQRPKAEVHTLADIFPALMATVGDV